MPSIFNFHFGAYLRLTRIVMLGLSSLLLSQTSLALNNHTVPWESEFTLPTQDSRGWSVLKPSSDSRLIYVSSSGDNSTAKTYSPSSPEIGTDPFNPTGAVKAYATISSAIAQARSGYPDYVLLKRGDSWTISSPIVPVLGRSQNERFVLSYYGSSTSRPQVRVDSTSDAILFKGNSSYSAIVGISFYSYQRDPSSPSFSGFNNIGEGKGFSGYVSGDLITGVLIEDCVFDYFSNNSLISAQENGKEIYNFIIRRNYISNNYSTTAHAQGIYSANASLYIEENVLDHNGWYMQSSNGGSEKSSGQATIFNHNIYFSQPRNIVIRKNFLLRPSSINTKFTSNAINGVNTVRSWNILLDNNLVVDGDVALSLGGNDDYDNGYRWRDMYVVNNVVTQVGRSRPTNRSLGWGIDVNDWDTGLVSNNIVKSWGSSTVNNIYALSVSGVNNNVSITENKFYDVSDNSGDDFLIKIIDSNLHKNTIFRNNDLVLPKSGRFIDMPDGFSNLSSSGNYYYASSSSTPFRISGATNSISQWSNTTKESLISSSSRDYVDPSRSIESYLSSLGQTPTIDRLSELLKNQSKLQWNSAYTADAINDYVRNGFCLKGSPCSTATPSAPKAPLLQPIVISQ